MINVTLKGEQVSVKPATLQNYIERVEYIKSRRISPIDALRNLPTGITQDNYAKFVEIAISSSMRLSAVDFDEEMTFDSSMEGYYFTVYQAMREHYKWPAEPVKGVAKAAEFWESLTKADQSILRHAIRGVDEMLIAGKSGSPAQTTEPG